MIAACKKHGKFPGMAGIYQEQIMPRYIDMGARCCRPAPTWDSCSMPAAHAQECCAACRPEPVHTATCCSPLRTLTASSAFSLNGPSSGRMNEAERTRCDCRIEARRRLALLHRRAALRSRMPRHDDGVVGRDQVLLGAVRDRPHAFLQRRVLHRDALDAAVVDALPSARRGPSGSRCRLLADRPERAGDQLGVDAVAVLHRLELLVGQRARRMVV